MSCSWMCDKQEQNHCTKLSSAAGSAHAAHATPHRATTSPSNSDLIELWWLLPKVFHLGFLKKPGKYTKKNISRKETKKWHPKQNQAG